MPYIRIPVTEEERQLLLRWSRLAEKASARLLKRDPERVTLQDAARGCFVEGLADLEARVSEYADASGDDEEEETP